MAWRGVAWRAGLESALVLTLSTAPRRSRRLRVASSRRDCPASCVAGSSCCLYERERSPDSDPSEYEPASEAGQRADAAAPPEKHERARSSNAPESLSAALARLKPALRLRLRLPTWPGRMRAPNASKHAQAGPGEHDTKHTRQTARRSTKSACRPCATDSAARHTAHKAGKPGAMPPGEGGPPRVCGCATWPASCAPILVLDACPARRCACDCVYSASRRSRRSCVSRARSCDPTPWSARPQRPRDSARPRLCPPTRARCPSVGGTVVHAQPLRLR